MNPFRESRLERKNFETSSPRVFTLAAVQEVAHASLFACAIYLWIPVDRVF